MRRERPTRPARFGHQCRHGRLHGRRRRGRRSRRRWRAGGRLRGRSARVRWGLRHSRHVVELRQLRQRVRGRRRPLRTRRRCFVVRLRLDLSGERAHRLRRHVLEPEQRPLQLLDLRQCLHDQRGNSHPECADGGCAYACDTGYTACGETCVDFMTTAPTAAAAAPLSRAPRAWPVRVASARPAPAREMPATRASPARTAAVRSPRRRDSPAHLVGHLQRRVESVHDGRRLLLLQRQPVQERQVRQGRPRERRLVRERHQLQRLGGPGRIRLRALEPRASRRSRRAGCTPAPPTAVTRTRRSRATRRTPTATAPQTPVHDRQVHPEREQQELLRPALAREPRTIAAASRRRRSGPASSTSGVPRTRSASTPPAIATRTWPARAAIASPAPTTTTAPAAPVRAPTTATDACRRQARWRASEPAGTTCATTLTPAPVINTAKTACLCVADSDCSSGKCVNHDSQCRRARAAARARSTARTARPRRRSPTRGPARSATATASRRRPDSARRRASLAGARATRSARAARNAGRGRGARRARAPGAAGATRSTASRESLRWPLCAAPPFTRASSSRPPSLERGAHGAGSRAASTAGSITLAG